MAAYYNELEPYAAQWLRNLIAKGLIADGEVDERSIVDVRPDDLRGFTQAHFFAGIGGWSHALRLAGWPDDREVWTGSCPCQPFSVAGKGLGADDPRHLWPHYHRLIAARRPVVVMGEQVAGAAGYGWLDGVRADLAREGYASRGVDIPACAVDAPHIRSRLYWVASDMGDANVRQSRAGRGDDGEMRGVPAAQRRSEDGAAVSAGGGAADGDMADAQRESNGRRGIHRPGEGASEDRQRTTDQFVGAGSDHSRDGTFWSDADDAKRRADGDMADASLVGWPEHARDAGERRERSSAQGLDERAGRGGVRASRNGTERGDMADADGNGQQGPEPTHSPFGGRRSSNARCKINGTFWSDAIWLTGADGKARRAQPGIPLLAHGIPARVGRLRAYGNAIVPQLAAEVIAAFMGARP